MADPANFVIVASGRAEFFCDRSGALGLPWYLLDGPQAWERHARFYHPADTPYDEVWGSGGVLMDKDRRLLRFYTRLNKIDHSPGLRRAFLPLLAERWPGWQVTYANRGWVDVLEHTGVDIEALRHEEREPLPAASAADLLSALQTIASVLGQPYDLEQYAAEVGPFEWFTGYDATVLTVRFADRGVRDHVGGMTLRWALGMGPALVDALSDAPPVASPNELCAGGGAWVDVPSRSLAVWQGRSGRLDLGALAARWLGWRIHEHDSGLPGQLRLSGRDGASVELPLEVLLAEAWVMFFGNEPGEERSFQAWRRDGDRYWDARRPSKAAVRAVLDRLASRGSAASGGTPGEGATLGGPDRPGQTVGTTGSEPDGGAGALD
jgi:hypothetical protein